MKTLLANNGAHARNKSVNYHPIKIFLIKKTSHCQCFLLPTSVVWLKNKNGLFSVNANSGL